MDLQPNQALVQSLGDGRSRSEVLVWASHLCAGFAGESGQSGLASPLTLSPRGLPASEASSTQSAQLILASAPLHSLLCLNSLHASNLDRMMQSFSEGLIRVLVTLSSDVHASSRECLVWAGGQISPREHVFQPTTDAKPLFPSAYPGAAPLQFPTTLSMHCPDKQRQLRPCRVAGQAFSCVIKCTETMLSDEKPAGDS